MQPADEVAPLLEVAIRHVHHCTAVHRAAQRDEHDSHRALIAGLEIAAATWKEAVDTFDWDAGGFELAAVHQISKVHTSSATP